MAFSTPMDGYINAKGPVGEFEDKSWGLLTYRSMFELSRDPKRGQRVIADKGLSCTGGMQAIHYSLWPLEEVGAGTIGRRPRSDVRPRSTQGLRDLRWLSGSRPPLQNRLGMSCWRARTQLSLPPQVSVCQEEGPAGFKMTAGLKPRDRRADPGYTQPG